MTERHEMLQPTVSMMFDHETQPAGRIGVAVVGLGWWGSNLLRVLADSSDMEVRWICDLDSSRLAKYRRRHPNARVTTRLDRMLADPGVDAIALGTPLDTRYDLVMCALEAGKHVLIKTPVATSTELADDLATVAAPASLYRDLR
jgi:predicted dehydrogenase